MGRATRAGDITAFGPFELDVGERLLTKGGAAVELGSRTLDTLIALVSCPNQIVSKKDLMAQVWPDVRVEEGSLRFHIAALRKALGDGREGARYITTLAGRGYCFVAPISPSNDQAEGNTPVVPNPPGASLPGVLTRMVGRDDDVLALSTLLAASRFVTIVGPGGIGKTTVAITIAHLSLEIFAGAVFFVDLGGLNDSNLVTTSLASMLGLSIQSNDPLQSLIAHLRDKQMLLIFDNCEHLVAAAAALASRIFEAAPQVHILTTSREALRVEGENVYRLAPLTFAPDYPGLTAAVALTFPATQLFMERAAASGSRLNLSDVDAPIVARICRKLDGLALAIELAAGRVGTYGLEQTAMLLDQRLTLLWQGQRTAPPRQKTLQATLDWSYGLLSELERLVLRQLAVFIGDFTLEAARAVVASPKRDQDLVFGAIDSLVAKSMVATRPAGALMRYRLLDTTRAYALEIVIEDAELAGLGARHATYYRRWLEQTATKWPTSLNPGERAHHLACLNNVRAALEWSFGEIGNTEIGVGLAAAAAPAFLAMSLLTECDRWSERANNARDDVTRMGREVFSLAIDNAKTATLTQKQSDLRIPGKIARDLGEKIVLGHLKPGAVLDDGGNVSGQRRVSKTALREAIRVLIAKGLVESRPSVGTCVSTLDKWHLLDPDILSWMFAQEPSPHLLSSLFQLRLQIEPEAASLAARRRSQEQLDQMAAALQEMTTETLRTAKGRLADQNFHTALLAASGNPFFNSLSSSVAAAVNWSAVFKNRSTGLERDPIPDHRQVYAAIAARDEVGARAAMRALLDLAFADDMTGSFRTQGS